MPNWCRNDITIYPSSEEKKRKIYEELEKALSANPLGAGFGNKWLGNLRYHIGVSEDVIIHWTDGIRCKGEVCDREEEFDSIRMITKSAWSPHVRCVEDFVRHYDKDAVVLYMACEPSNELYQTNDAELAGLFFVDSFIQPEEGSKGALLNAEFGQHLPKDAYFRMLIDYLVLTDIDGQTQASLEDAVNEKLKEVNEDFYIYAHEFDFVPIEDCY